MDQYDLDVWHMQRALDLAAQGQGLVEPNPMVGSVIVQGAEIIGEGWHRRFGGPHAEVEALKLAGHRAQEATLYVTLEPCCHHGKTPPCTQALLEAKIARVVVAQRDPFPKVDGGGISELREAGIEVETGLLEPDARRLNAPYLTLQEAKRPWIIAKWAMTLDGKTATKTGFSKWISNEQSREIVHELRGRVDAIMTGRLTARLDDPLLTARPPGPRTAVRIVVDTRASLASDSQLARTAGEVPVLVAVGAEAPAEDRRRLKKAGCEVYVCRAETRSGRLNQLLHELGRRQMTNLLVEGGGQLTGCFLDSGQIDEAHVFIAPKLIGGTTARSPIAGDGIDEMPQAFTFAEPHIRQLGSDIYFHGRLRRD